MGFVKKVVRGIGKIVGGLLGTGDMSDAVREQVDAVNAQTSSTNAQAAEIQRSIAELSKQNATIAQANEKARADSLQQQQEIQRQQDIAAEAARVRQENLAALETANAAGEQVADVTPGGTASAEEEGDLTAAERRRRRSAAPRLSATLGIGG